MAGIKLISLGGGAGGKRNGSGESDGKNLVRMRSILSTMRDVAGKPLSELHDVNDDSRDDTRPRHAADTATCASSQVPFVAEKRKKNETAPAAHHARCQLG